MSSSALQLLGHQAGAGAQLGWSCCGWEAGTGDLWGSLRVAGAERCLLQRAESDSTSGGSSSPSQGAENRPGSPLGAPSHFPLLHGELR